MSNERAPLFTYDEMRNEILPKITSLPEAQEFNRNSIAFGVGAASLVLLTSYEAARAKDAELIQRLVDELRILRIEFGNRVGQTTQIGIASLSDAEDAGFKPSEPWSHYLD